MARKLRVQYEGAIYHVTARGVERRVIFDDDRDREHFLDRLSDSVEEYGVRLYLFCLMSNHFHLLIETPGGNLSAFMHKLQTAHTVFYNRRHERAGHLLQGRFNAKIVEGNEYLNALSRYVHLNPVYIDRNRSKALAERVKYLRAYKWSSYQGYAGLAKPLEFVEQGPLLMMAGGRKERQRMLNYRRFVESGIAESDQAFAEILKNAKWGIGGAEFQAVIRDLHVDMALKVRRTEDVSLRKVEWAVRPDVVVKAVSACFGVEPDALSVRSYGSRVRAVAARMLIRYSGMNQRDAGSYLRIGTGAAVSQQLQALRNSADTGLADKIAKLDAVFLVKARDASSTNLNLKG